MPIEHPHYPVNPLTADAFGSHISIHADLHDIEIPRVDAALASTISVDEANPWYSTDGFCLFSKDGSTLIRCLTNVVDYTVPPSCTRIDDEAFAYNTVIEHIRFNEGLTDIGARAFIASTLRDIDLPPSMRRIGFEAFAEAKDLKSVQLSEGILEIGDGAFLGCRALERMNIPASVRELGPRTFSQCTIACTGAEGGLVISPENERYFIDDRGVLYRRDGDEIALMCALASIDSTYRVVDGTTKILARAFAFNRILESIRLPEGMTVIEERAFAECEALSEINLPEGLTEIGAEAFYHTRLKRLRLPSTLEKLGPASLVVNITISSQSRQAGVGGRGAGDFYHTALSGRIHGISVPRFDVEVAPKNARYTLSEGFLCERDAASDELTAVQYVGGDPIAIIAPNVTRIAEYAMFGVENVRELHLHTGIKHIGHSALAISYPLDLVEVDDGNGLPIRLYPAPNSSGTVAQRKAFRAGFLDLDLLVRDCDSSLSFMMPGVEKAYRMLLRLSNGRCLSNRFKDEFTSVVRLSTDELIRRFARLGDLGGIHDLIECEFIDATSIAHAIEVANAVGGTACARVLLEEKRTRYPSPAFDFEL